MTDLKALSDAATQGEWSVCYYDCGDMPHYDHNGPCPSIQCESADTAIVHWDGFKQEYWSSANGNGKQIEANAALITALVNEYRAGRIGDTAAAYERGIRDAAEVAGKYTKAYAADPIQLLAIAARASEHIAAAILAKLENK